MLQTVTDACQFREEALEYALSRQVEDLSNLIGHSPAAAEAFFDKTFVTEGMSQLLRQGLDRLAGKSDQAVFELRQAMGGGKTHSMLALGYLAANPELAPKVDTRITQPSDPAKVVVISGRDVDRDKFIWGMIADQLGKADQFATFWRSGPEAPNESDWVKLIGDDPVLILFDELPPYLDGAVTRPVGSGSLADVTSQALTNLLSAALRTKHLCIVISTLVGQYKSSADLTRIVSQITNEARRSAKPITPVELGSDEIYHILRKRLLIREPGPAIVEGVADAFGRVLSDAVKAKTLDRAAERIAEEVTATYPFHPSLKTVVATFKDNEGFRQTRGLMTIAAMMVRSVQRRTLNDVYLIGPQHLDLANRDIRDQVNRIYDLDAAITVDIVDTGQSDAHAELIDAAAGNEAASEAARLILMASLAESSDAVKGLQSADILSYLVAPQQEESAYVAGLEALISKSWYLHKRDNGAWYFSKNENLTKKIENTARNAPAHKIDADLRRRVEEIFRPVRRNAYSRVLPLPEVEDVNTRGDRALIVLSPDTKLPPEKAQKLFDATPDRNNFAIVSGEGSSLSSVEQKLRTSYAISRVLEQEGVGSPNRPDLEQRAAEADLDAYQTIASTLNLIWYPGRRGAEDSLLSAPLKLDNFRRQVGAGYDGETAVETALTTTGSRKLVEQVEHRFDELAERAEDMLWPPLGRFTTWSEAQDRALSNVRWLWLPRGGIDELRRLAVSRGRWKESGAGVEKGPFEKEKTSVSVTEAAYDDETGEATINVLARNAGRQPRIYMSTSADVSQKSERLEDTTIRTRATKLYFLAVDSFGEHETGEPFMWPNRLSLSHQPQHVGAGYEVSLTVVPAGQIRWNTDATAAREGQVYTGPITLPGDKDVTIYAYAEADGLTVTKDFKIPARSSGGTRIDPDRPATARRVMNVSTTDKVFAVIAQGKQSGATMRSALVRVGVGARNIQIGHSPELDVTADALERVIKFARAELGDENAEVAVTWKSVSVARAADLQPLMSILEEPLEDSELEQD